LLRSGARSGLPLGEVEEVRDVVRLEDLPDHERHSCACPVPDDLRVGEGMGTATGDQLAVAGGQNVLDPVRVPAVRERDDGAAG
jgi:hypothetical protein